MKYNTQLILFLLLFTATQAMAQMKFQHGSWDEILAKAADQDKIIFVDAYADWCGPCKMMDKNVFSNTSVGEYYNETFLNVKIDMEKGEGPGLARKYKVRAYPSFLFVDSNGELVHRGIGYQPVDQFLALGQAASDTENGIGSLEKRFKRGERDPEFLYDLAKMKIDMMDGGHKKIVEAYLETQEDWTSEKSMELIFHTVDDVNSEMFKFFVDNKASFENIFGRPYLENKIFDLAAQQVFNGEATPDFGKGEAVIRQLYPDIAKKSTMQMKLNYYHNQGDFDKFGMTTVDYLDQFPSDNYQELNSYAWAFYQSVEDKKMLKKAVGWAEKSIELNEEYYNLDTLSALYAKLNKKRKARKYGKLAIEMAKANGDDYSETETLLKNL
jgi:thioredoxin-related protein